MTAPAGTPDEVVKRLNEEMDKILKTPEVARRLAELGFFTEGAGTPAATRAFVQSQYELWGKLTRDIGLQPE